MDEQAAPPTPPPVDDPSRRAAAPAYEGGRLALVLALAEIPWFIVLSILRIGVQGSTTRPLVRLIDVAIPLPVVLGFVHALRLLWRHRLAPGPGRGVALAGAALCGTAVLVFASVLF